MSEFTIAQLVGAIMGSVIAITIAGIAKMLNGDKDSEY